MGVVVTKLEEKLDIWNAKMVEPHDMPAYYDLTQIKGIIMFPFAPDRNIKMSNERGLTSRKKERKDKAITKLLAELFKNQEFHGQYKNKKLSKRLMQSKEFVAFIYAEGRQTLKSIIQESMNLNSSTLYVHTLYIMNHAISQAGNSPCT